MKAIVLIKIETGDVKQVYRDLKRIGSISEVHLTFGPYDVIAVIQTESLFTLGKIVSEQVQTIPGVQQTITCLMVETELPVNESPRASEEHLPPAGLFGKN
jgi:DNA-binding Lrp family transcriptional regulator